MKAALLLLPLLLLVTACSSSRAQFRLEEWGEGWKLDVREDGTRFRASWVKGDHRSAKLVNYHDAETGNYVVVNTLYLELDPAGKVLEGRLKRVAMPDFERESYYERNAQWFRVLAGTCTLDANGAGSVDVKCEGNYAFAGGVTPMDDLKVTKPK